MLSEIGAKRLWESDRGIAWGTAKEKPGLAIMKPCDGKMATVGNGVMVEKSCYGWQNDKISCPRFANKSNGNSRWFNN